MPLGGEGGVCHAVWGEGSCHNGRMVMLLGGGGEVRVKLFGKMVMPLREKGHASWGEGSCHHGRTVMLWGGGGGEERGYGSGYLGGKVMPLGDLGHASWGERSRYVERKVL